MQEVINRINKIKDIDSLKTINSFVVSKINGMLNMETAGIKALLKTGDTVRLTEKCLARNPKMTHLRGVDGRIEKKNPKYAKLFFPKTGSFVTAPYSSITKVDLDT